MPPPTLYERARHHLKDDKRSILDIHKESGLPFHWLRKVSEGSIPDPGVNKVQRLYEFLTNTQLQLK